MRSFVNRRLREQGSRGVTSGRIGLALGALLAIGCATNKSDDNADSGALVIEDAGGHDTGHTTFDATPDPLDAGDDSTPPTDDASTDDGSADDAEAGNDADDGALATDACTPTPLACDGVDHNCNGTVDQGCPSAITFGAPTSDGALWGNPAGGVAFTDACPTGQVLIGMQGHVGASIDGIGGLCGIVSLNENTATKPYTYSLSIVPGSLLPSHGGTTTTAFTRQCPLDQAVVKVSGQSGQLIDGFVLTCAPLVVGGAAGAFTIAQGTTTTDLNFVGGTGGSPFAPFACPSTQIARVIGGRGGNSLDALSISCGTPALTLR